MGDGIVHSNPIASHYILSNDQHNPMSQPNMCFNNYNYLSLSSHHLPIIFPLSSLPHRPARGLRGSPQAEAEASKCVAARDVQEAHGIR